jgi:hypothetical protein
MIKGVDVYCSGEASAVVQPFTPKANLSFSHLWCSTGTPVRF